MSSSRDPKTGRFLKGNRIHKDTTIKKTMKLAEARRKGELAAELKAHKTKPLEESLKEHIGKIIDRTNVKDVAEAAIMGALAWLSYEKFQPNIRYVDVHCMTKTVPGEGGVGFDLKQQSEAQIATLKIDYDVREIAGTETFKKDSNPIYAIIGPLGYKLAVSRNDIGSAAGVATLAVLGVLSTTQWGPAPQGTPLRSAEDWSNWFLKQLGL